MASTDRIDGFTAAEAIKAPCRVATTANITLSGLQTIDGVTVVADDRVLVKDQDSPSENGIYLAKSGAWVRAKDWNGNRDIMGGTRVWVTEGTQAAVDGSGSVVSSFYVPTFTNGVQRSLQGRLEEFMLVTDFGAKGDGVTDDTTAIQNALAAAGGRTLWFPKGIYVVSIDATNLFTPQLNTIMRGEGPESIIRFNMTDASTYALFDINNNGCRFEHMKFEINTSVTGGTIVMFKIAASTAFLNVEVDGNVTGDSGSSHLCQVVSCDASTNFDYVMIKDCYFHDITRCWLRANTATSTINGFYVLGSRFENSESAMFSLNAPNGEIAHASFANNWFKNPFIGSVQTDSICIGAHATNISITGNSFDGTGQKCINVEETARNLVISGNTVEMDCEAGIAILDNNVSGVSDTPDNVSITGNVIRRLDDDGATGTGIELVNDGGDPPISTYTITGNVITGWGEGIKSGADAHDMGLVANNTIEGCGVGLRPKNGAPNWRGNMIGNCTTGIQTIGNGGMIGHNTFYGNTTNVDAVTGEVTLQGATFLFDDATLTASGDTDFALLPAGANDYAFGWITGHVEVDGTNEDIHMQEFKIDAGTLSFASHSSGWAPGITRGGGQVSISFVDSSDVLTMRAANSSSILTNAKVFCEIQGSYVIAA